MRPLNPFLRAFFSSRLPAQCVPTTQYILLIPPTEFLLTHRDRDTQASYPDLATSEELLACHIIRAPVGTNHTGRDGTGTLRDSKGKARQYSTLNGRTIVIKDSTVYTNKGFKSLVQAKLLQDAIYYQDSPESSQWLIYYISRPLVGVPEQLQDFGVPEPEKPTNTVNGASVASLTTVDSFGDLLVRFPIIARQVHPGLDKLFDQFSKELEDITVNAAIESSKQSSDSGSSRTHRRSDSVSSTLSLSSRVSSFSKYVSHETTWEENQMRRSVESLVLSAIDLFQAVDKQQLSLLGASTSLSGPEVESMIERFVTEHFHADVLFPRLCGLMESQDTALETSIRQMVDVDISQVGISIQGGQRERLDLSRRLHKAVDAFRKMNAATSPHEMLQSLLETQKCLTVTRTTTETSHGAEKQPSSAVFSADQLVSLLLVVVIRSPVHNLQARLAYMRDFLFVTDVDSGENGYALSTYEAVLGYLTHHSSGLRTASRANRALWSAARKGNVAGIQKILEAGDSAIDMSGDESPLPFRRQSDEHQEDSRGSELVPDGHDVLTPESNGLRHVFPFRTQEDVVEFALEEPEEPEAINAKLKKRVSMDARTMSSSSGRSYLSGSSTLLSASSMLGETHSESLVQTQDSDGRSALMMVVERGHADAFKYMLGLEGLYTADHVMDDADNEGITILSAAAQNGKPEIIVMLLDWLLAAGTSRESLQVYLSQQDSQGRSAAHYIFNCWWLIHWLDVRGFSLPWRLKDKNQQTPLFALCRSWDQEGYFEMVRTGIAAATKAQNDGESLHLDDHIDAKGNTLLHISHDPQITRKLLYSCDSDPNTFNEKHLTPLMMASKFAREDQIRMLFGDARIDLQARDHRGLTAVELAKDDEVRNRIDDMLLLSAQAHAGDNRTTTIVRSFFVDDGSVRLIIKSAAPNGRGTITVTTCRRSPAEFEALARWLSLEHPASWMPSIMGFRSPFQLMSKPSRMVLRDLQIRLDIFLKELLNHPTFETHEMLWEFFLVPDVDPAMLADRAHRKAEARVDKLREEYAPLIHSIPEVEAFVQFARDQVSSMHRGLKSVFRRVNAVRNVTNDLVDAHRMASGQLSHTLPFLPPGYLRAYSRYVDCLQQAESSPLATLHYTILGTLSTTTALQSALLRPGNLIGSINAARDQVLKHNSQLNRSQRWPSALGLLDDARARLQHESLERADKASGELDMLGRELRYTQTTVASELAGWQVVHRRKVRDGLRDWARQTLVTERARLDAMRRALREIRIVKEDEARSLGAR